ncbi:MAG: hypothetical protein AAF432_02675 [Planctomycetota bacterium]
MTWLPPSRRTLVHTVLRVLVCGLVTAWFVEIALVWTNDDRPHRLLRGNVYADSPADAILHSYDPSLHTTKTDGWWSRSLGTDLFAVVGLRHDGELVVNMRERRSGWPFRQTRGQAIYLQPSGPAIYRGIVCLSYAHRPGSDPFQQRYAFTFLPIWQGLIANAIILGIPTYLLCRYARSRLRIIRTINRHRDGRCLGCGYIVDATDVCSECGRPFVRSVP